MWEALSWPLEVRARWVVFLGWAAARGARGRVNLMAERMGVWEGAEQPGVARRGYRENARRLGGE
jgi:hypothetical protein